MVILNIIGSYVFKKLFLYQLLSSLVIYYAISIVRFYIVRNRRYKLLQEYGYKGPKPSLLLGGNLNQYYVDKKIHLVTAKNELIYGPTWAEYQGDIPTIITTDPALIKYVFLENADIFSEKTKLPVDIKMAHGILFSPHKDKWKMYRKILASSLGKMKILGLSSTKFVADGTHLMVDYINNEVAKGSSNIDLYKLFKCNALYMVSEMAIKLPIGISEDEPNVAGLDDYLAKMNGESTRIAMIFPFLFRILTYLINAVLINGYMKIIYRSLDQRFAMTSKRLDEEEKLMSNSMDKNRLDDKEPIIDNLIRLVRANKLEYIEYVGNVEGLLIAGYHTTSTTLIYAIWCLSKHADIQERLFDDLLMKGIASKYLEQVLNESMRVYPVVFAFVNRVATKSTQFNGRCIPEGTLVVYPTHTMHNHLNYWPEPEKFDPNRFADTNAIDPIYFAPFGFGERRCLGYKLALLEMKVLITELVLRYKLILKSPQTLGLTSCDFFVSEPDQPVKIMLEKRPFDLRKMSHNDD